MKSIKEFFKINRGETIKDKLKETNDKLDNIDKKLDNLDKKMDKFEKKLYKHFDKIDMILKRYNLRGEGMFLEINDNLVLINEDLGDIRKYILNVRKNIQLK